MKVKNFKDYQYENVFEVPDYSGKGVKKKVMARLFDPVTKSSVFQEVTHYSIPSIYSYSKHGTFTSYLDNNLKLSPKTFNTMDDYNKYVKKIKVKTGEMVQIEFDGEELEFEETVFEDDVYGYTNPCHTFIHKYYQNSLKSNHIQRTWFLDIETRSGIVVPNSFPHSSTAYEEISMIQIYDNFTKRYIVLGRKDFTGKFEQPNTQFIKIENEAKLLHAFLKLLEKMQPSIISGWNSMLFDIPYITNRIARVLDGFNGDPEDLNQRKSYLEMENVKRLSPVGSVMGKKSKTQDAMEGVTTIWQGIALVDYRELTIKYGFLGLPSYSLSAVAQHFKLAQKLDHSTYSKFDDFYTGDNYFFPPELTPEIEADEVYIAQLAYKNNTISKTQLQQIVYDRFVDYSIRDVEILVQLDEISKYLASQQGIAYTCSVSFDDAWGTAKQWASYIYSEAYQKNEILPLKQRYADPDVVFLAGWVRNVPGKYNFITSFDFTSLYPSVIQAYNIGADVMVQEHEMPDELRALRKKFFYYHTMKMVNRALELSDGTAAPLGEMVIKHHGEISDLEEETMYYKSLIDNKDEISAVLKKYNVSATPNGFFYKKDQESLSSILMRRNFQNRVKHKRKGQSEAAYLEEIKKDIQEQGETPELLELQETTKSSKEYNENQSQVLKLLLNSYYGSLSLKHITYSNGNITAASVTTGGRMANKLASLACHNKVQDILGEEHTTDLKWVPQVDTDSLYLNAGEIMNMPKFKALNKADKIKIVLKMSNGMFQDVINEAMDNLGEALNLKDRNALVMENEIIADGFVSLAAKRYFARKVVEDGTILTTPKMKSTGISLVSKSTPLFLREKLAPVLEIILDETNVALNTYITDVRKEFGELNPLEFCRKSKVNNLDYKATGFKYKKQKEDGKFLTAPINSHASLEYNKYVKKHNLVGKYNVIEKGESIQYVYVQEPNELHIHNALAWTDPNFANDIDVRKITNYDTHFEKDFMKKVDIVIKPIGWDIYSKTQEMDVW